MFCKLVASGSYLPEKILTNKDLEKTLDTTDEWIASRTGIKERHIASPLEKTSDMAARAAERALKNAGLTAADIDLLLVATTTPDLEFPSVACIVQNKIGMFHGAPAMDVRGACTGFIYALHQARAFFAAGMFKRIMVIGAEKMSQMVDWTDRNTAVLFGDGAGCMIFEAIDEPGMGILGTEIFANGEYLKMLHATDNRTIYMEGSDVYRQAVQRMPEAALAVMNKLNLTRDDIDWAIPHQANIRIIEGVVSRFGIPMDRVIVTVNKHANTSAASIPLAFDDARTLGQIKNGQTVLAAAFGAGLTWGAAVIKV